jgi:hypothetical protein
MEAIIQGEMVWVGRPEFIAGTEKKFEKLLVVTR